MGDVIKQRLRRYNGTDYDTVHLETDGAVVEVEAPERVSILNTDSPVLGDNTVYFRYYPDIKWQVQHIDGDYVYLALAVMTEFIKFGSSTSYSGSTIASKCTDYLTNTIPNMAQYLEDVTVNGVTSKVFVPSYEQMSSEWDWPKAGNSNRICQLNGSNTEYWTSTVTNSSIVWYVHRDGDFYDMPAQEIGFRPAVKVNYKQTIPGGTTTKVLNTVIGDITDSLQDIDGANVTVTLPAVMNPLNTDQLTLGQTGVYFKVYPSITWQVQHIDGDYVYLALASMTSTTVFGSSTSYSGSTIASRCATYLSNTIPDVAEYLENVTVEGVTAKVFIPSKAMYETDWDWPRVSASNRICQLNGSNYYYWTSTAYSSSSLWRVTTDGGIGTYGSPSYNFGFRPAVKVRYKFYPDIKDLNAALSDLNDRITSGRSELTPGTSTLATGTIYLQYE